MAQAKRTPDIVRCAIYTRVSTSMQAEGEFSSIDNQFESAQALIRSQQDNGWQLLPHRYDDAGFSAATMNRPALRRLLADIEAGLIDVVIVYKLDRLSRNQRDLLALLDEFGRRGVAFRSVTQNFDTSGPMGKAMLGMLGVFAELERGMISERTRDKVQAARARGRWTGGVLPLGYDLKEGKLVVNETEAAMVREIFELYLQKESVTDALAEILSRGWRTKSWVTQKGTFHEGKPWTVDTLRRLLTSPYPVGRVSAGDTAVEGEHEAILDEETWEDVQVLLAANGNTGGRKNRNRSRALLQGILRCSRCNAPMTPTASQKGNVQYRYYSCCKRRRGGAAACPNGNVSAPVIEDAVIGQIREIAKDPDLIEATVQAALDEHERQQGRREAEIGALSAEIQKLVQEEQRLIGGDIRGDSAARAVERRLDQLARQKRDIEARITGIQEEQTQAEPPDTDQLRRTLESFEPVWEALEPIERSNLARLLISGVAYDPDTDEIEIGLTAAALRDEEAA